MNTLPEDQKAQYGNFWQQADTDRDGQIGQNDALTFFQQSGLSMETLGLIWSQVNPNSSPTLSPDQFVYACQLIAMGQNGRTPNISELQQIKATGAVIPLPLFGAQPQGPSSPLTSASSLTSSNQGASLEITAADHQSAQQHFATLDTDKDGYVQGGEAYPFFLLSSLSQDVLAQIWTLSDVDGDGKLDLKEFTVATFLISQITQGRLSSPPSSLPPSLRASIWSQSGSNFGSQQGTTLNSSSGSIYTVTPEEIQTDTSIFQEHNVGGYIEGNGALTVLRMSGLSDEELGRAYAIADTDGDGRLSQNEFFIAMKLIRTRLNGHQFPSTLPPELTIGSNSVPRVAPTDSSSSVVKLLEDRIADLTSRNSAYEQELGSLRIANQTLREEQAKSSIRIQDLESQLQQASAKVNALGESAQQASTAMSQIQQLSVQLNEAYSKMQAQQTAYSELETRFNQQAVALTQAQQQVAAAQQQAAVNQARVTPLAPAPQVNPFGATSTPAQANPFGGSSAPLASSAANPFLMGVDTSSSNFF